MPGYRPCRGIGRHACPALSAVSGANGRRRHPFGRGLWYRCSSIRVFPDCSGTGLGPFLGPVPNLILNKYLKINIELFGIGFRLGHLPFRSMPAQPPSSAGDSRISDPHPVPHTLRPARPLRLRGRHGTPAPTPRTASALVVFPILNQRSGEQRPSRRTADRPGATESLFWSIPHFPRSRFGENIGTGMVSPCISANKTRTLQTIFRTALHHRPAP